MITFEHIYKTERDTLKFRLIALIIVGVGLYFRKDTINIWPLVILLSAYMVYAMSLGPFLIPRIKRIQVIYGMILVDAVVVNLGLYLAGGVRSYIFVLLPLLVIYYSMYFGYASSLFSATVFSGAYVITAILLGDYITQTPYIALQAIFLYLAALLTGYLSRRRLQEMKERVELQEALHLENQAKNLLDLARRLVGKGDSDDILVQESRQKIENMIEVNQHAVLCLERNREPAGKREIVIDDLLHLNGSRGIATYDGKPLELSVTEFELLYLLAENAANPVNSETLLRRVWGQNYSGQANVVDVTVHRLRRKLESSGAKGLIATVRGIGYMLVKIKNGSTSAVGSTHG